MRFIFLGTAEFGLPALQRLLDLGHECCGVVTNPPKPAGRGLKIRQSPVFQYCEEHSISPIFTPDSLKDENFQAELKKTDAEIFVVVAFSILPESLFSIPPKGTFNIHAALLPQFRGPAPIHRAIETGSTETGVTLFRIDRGIDTGNILVQLRCPIFPTDTTPTLYERLSVLGSDAIQQGFEILSAGTESYLSQDHEKATKAPLLKKEEGYINWNDTAANISNRIRAFVPFPGSFTNLNGYRLGIEQATVSYDHKDSVPGTIVSVSSNGITIACGKDALVATQVKPAGKRSMPVRDFINGSIIQEGTILE